MLHSVVFVVINYAKGDCYLNAYEQEELMKKRDYRVVKSNQLVQKSRFDLSLTEQRVAAYICSLIKPMDIGIPYQTEYVFDIREYAKVCGLHLDSGRLYEETKAVLQKLMQKIIKLKLPDNSELMMAWLVTVHAAERSGKFKIRINEDIVPHLFGLEKNFTAYAMLNILAMKSRYSLRIYELMQSCAYKKEATFDIDELKMLLMADGNKSYDKSGDFKKRVLDPAMNEINVYTDLTVCYVPIKKGRKIDKIKFYISKKATFDRFIAHTKTSEEIR